MSDSMLKTNQYMLSNNICLALYEWGKAAADKPDDARETVVLIHGYPDSAEVWNGVAEQLAVYFHVVAYDVRGAGKSDIPARQHDYAFDLLVGDLSNVIAKVSPNRPVHLVGHDWGALQGWEAVLDDRLKDQIASYTAMGPSLDHIGWWFHRQLRKRTLGGYASFVKQLLGSSYMGMFQLPLLPELTWKLGLHRLWPLVVGSLEKTTVKASPSLLKDAVNPIGLYRENLLKPLLNPGTRKTSVPVNLLVMTKDPFVPSYLSEGMQEWANDIVYTEVRGGHWGILSQPAAVAANITRYVQQQSALNHPLNSPLNNRLVV